MFSLFRRLQKSSRIATAPPQRASFRPACEELEAREVLSSLFIDGQEMVQTKVNYLAYIKYVTVDPDKQTGPIFNGTDMAAIEKLEDPLRRQIFDAMSRTPPAVRTFKFASLDDAKQNFQLRIDVTQFMNNVARDRL